MKRRPSIVTAAILLLLVLASSPSHTHTIENKAPEKAYPPQVVTAVVLRAWPPQYNVDQRGKPFGFAIDILEAISSRANLTVNYLIKENFSEAIGSLTAGEANLIANTGIAPKFRDQMDYTLPLETFVVSIFVRNDTSDITDQSDLTGRKIGVVKTNIGEFLFRQRQDVDVTVYTNIQTMLLELIAGQIDAAIYPQSVLLALAREAGIGHRIKPVGLPLKEVKRGIGVEKNNPELLTRLNTVIGDFVRSTEYRDIYTNWYGLPDPYWTIEKIAAVAAVLLFLAVLGMFWWRYRIVIRFNNELQDAVERRKLAELRFREFAEGASDWFWELDSNLRGVYFFGQTPHPIGHHSNELIGATPHQSAHLAEDDGFAAFLAKLDAREPIHDLTYSMRNHDGKIVYRSVSGRPVFDANGEFTGYRGSSKDITDKAVAEIALLQSQERLSNILNLAPDAIISVDANSRVTMFTGGAANIFGYQPEEVVGQPLDMLIPTQFHEAHKRHVAEFIKSPESNRYMATRTEVSGRRKDGSDFPAEASISKQGTGNEIILTVILQDISKRREAEKTKDQFIHAVQQLAEGIAIFDSDDRLVVCNTAFKEAARPLDHLVVPGVKFETYLRACVEEGLYPAAKDDPEGWLADRMDRHKHSSEPFEIVREDRVILVQEGSISTNGRALVIFDITELKEREAQLQQAQKLEAVGQLTGGISHDFNNLLGVIIGNLDLMSEQLPPDSSLQTLVKAATDAALSGAHLNRQMLAYSRKQPLAPRSLDVNAHIDGLLDMIVRTLGATIEVRFEKQRTLWPCIADPAQLETALLNLCINARDAMPNGGRLSISTNNLHIGNQETADKNDLAPGDYVTLTVSDNGIGIPQEALEKVIEPFYTTKGVGEGSGLGLSMVFGFAKQSSGGLTLDSEVGQGTTAIIYLPRAAKLEQRAALVDESSPAARGESILIVEDNPEFLTLTSNLLTDLRYKVYTASNSAEALDFLSKFKDIDLVVSDVILPGVMNGLQLKSEINQRWPHVKFLLMSGYLSNTQAPAKSDDYETIFLEKPYRNKDFARRIHEVLTSRR